MLCYTQSRQGPCFAHHRSLGRKQANERAGRSVSRGRDNHVAGVGLSFEGSKRTAASHLHLSLGGLLSMVTSAGASTPLIHGTSLGIGPAKRGAVGEAWGEEATNQSSRDGTAAAAAAAALSSNQPLTRPYVLRDIPRPDLARRVPHNLRVGLVAKMRVLGLGEGRVVALRCGGEVWWCGGVDVR